MILSRMQKAGILLLIFVLYLILGLVAPLLHTPELTEETKQAQIPVSDFYGEKESMDRAMILETGKSAWEERLRLLNQAQSQIVLTTFDIRDEKSTRDILSVLLQKADKGVKVRILVDGLNGWYRMGKSSLFKSLTTHPNITIKLYNPIHVLAPWKNQYRMHDKYVIVDDLGYIIGGRNTNNYFIGDYSTKSRSLDREVLIYNTKNGTKEGNNSSIVQLQNYFEGIWQGDFCRNYAEKKIPSIDQEKKLRELQMHYNKLVQKHTELFCDLDFKEDTVPVNAIHLVFNNPNPVAKEPVIFHTMTELMKQAKDQVTVFTPYAVFNDYMKESLKEVSDRVPDTKIVINSVENGDNFVASSDYLRHKQDVLDSGFQIYEYDGGTSTHGKSLAIDDRLSVIGSYNLDLRSTYLCTESMLVIDSQELNKELRHNFNNMQEDTRKLVSPNEYDIPDDLEIREVSGMQKFAWWLVGLILQPFRLTI